MGEEMSMEPFCKKERNKDLQLFSAGEDGGQRLLQLFMLRVKMQQLLLNCRKIQVWCIVRKGTESTLFVASGMYASIVMFLGLVPPGSHIITTTDCYRKPECSWSSRLQSLILQILKDLGRELTLLKWYDLFP
ncbi:hypothetical protein Droror1_Dr00017642 [Drosera rotundifolia]